MTSTGPALLLERNYFHRLDMDGLYALQLESTYFHFIGLRS